MIDIKLHDTKYNNPRQNLSLKASNNSRPNGNSRWLKKKNKNKNKNNYFIDYPRNEFILFQ